MARPKMVSISVFENASSDYQKLKNGNVALKYKLFAMGSFIVKEGDCKILQLSLDMKRRRWFDSLWGLSNKFAMPVTY